MRYKFLGKKLLFIIAHPDDESYTSAGTIYKNYQAGGESNIICATYGEKGKSHLGKKVNRKNLKIFRKNELEEVSKFLHINKLIALKLSDSVLSTSNNKKILYKKIKEFVEKIKPDFIFSFGEDGISGHLDHVVIGKVSKKVAKENNVPFIAFCGVPSLFADANEFILRRTFGVYVSKIKRHKPNILIKINSKIKRKALSFHKSQLVNSDPFEHIPKKAVKEILNFEYFVI